jgi:putative drug exporter of the RND superfamily
MFTRIGRFVVRHPWKVIGVWLVAAALVVALSPTVDDIVNEDDKAFVPDSYESSKAATAEARAFADSKDGSSIIVFKRADGGKLQTADRAEIANAVKRLNAARVEHVVGVETGNQLVSPQGDTQLAAVKFDAPDVEHEAQDAAVALRAETRKALEGSGLTAGQTGGAAVQHDFHEGITEAETVVSIATVLLIIVLTGVIFRSPVAALLPIVTVGLVSQMADGLIADVAKLSGFEADFTLPVLLVVVLFGIGTDYILFVLFRYRERLRAGDEPGDAVAFAVGRVGEAVASSALVVVAAFCALLLSALESNQTLGPSLAISVLVMLAAGLTLIPAVLAVLGPRVFWPSKAWMREPEAGLSRRFAGALVRRPVAFALAPLGVLAALAVGMASLTPDYDQFTAMKSDKEASKAFNDLKASFPQGAIDPTKVVVTGDERLQERELGALAKRLGEVKGVEAVTPPELSRDGETARLRVLLAHNPSSDEALNLVEGPVRDVAHSSQAGDRVFVGGTSSANADLRAGNDEDRSTVYPAAAALIALILALLLRSVVAPLFLLVSVGLGFAATLGATVFLFQDIAGDPGLSFKVPILVYLFVVAIGTDYNILITARVREEVADGADTREAVRKALEAAGPTVAAAAAILAGTFASLMISGVSSFVQIGLAVCGGIILSAFLLGTMLVPALTAKVGERMWWPGRPGGAPQARRRASAGITPTPHGASESA